MVDLSRCIELLTGVLSGVTGLPAPFREVVSASMAFTRGTYLTNVGDTRSVLVVPPTHYNGSRASLLMFVNFEEDAFNVEYPLRALADLAKAISNAVLAANAPTFIPEGFYVTADSDVFGLDEDTQRASIEMTFSIVRGA